MYRNKRYVLWFRNDLRLHDNEALTEAIMTGAEIYPIFVFEKQWFESKSPFGFRRIGKLRQNFILESVKILSHSLKEIGLDLVVKYGDSVEEVFKLAKELKSRCVLCNRERTTEEVLIQENLEKKLWTVGQELRYFRGKMLLYTADLPFPVTHVPDHFSSFRKEVEQLVPIREPLPKPDASAVLPPSVAMESDELEIDSGSDKLIKGGEEEALMRFEHFSNELISAEEACQFFEPHLSPYLSQGCLSPKFIYHQLKGRFEGKYKDFLKLPVIQDLLFRDYVRLIGKKYGDQIFFKHGIKKNDELAFSRSASVLDQLKKAQTDDEFINAILNQLMHTGFIPRFAREYFGRYLVEHLKVDWRIGAELFEEYLLDYDPCSNWVNWQLLSGQGPCGPKDPLSQLDYLRKKYDPEGVYFGRWDRRGNEALI